MISIASRHSKKDCLSNKKVKVHNEIDAMNNKQNKLNMFMLPNMRFFNKRRIIMVMHVILTVEKRVLKYSCILIDRLFFTYSAKIIAEVNLADKTANNTP